MGSTYGGVGILPNLINNFAGYSAVPGTTGGSATATLVSHSHTGTTNNAGEHSHSYTQPQIIGNGEFDNNVQVGPTFVTQTTGVAGDHNHTFTTSTEGPTPTTNTANLPPYVGMLPVIKY